MYIQNDLFDNASAVAADDWGADGPADCSGEVATAHSADQDTLPLTDESVPVTEPAATLQEVLHRLLDAGGSVSSNAEMRSALNVVGKVLGHSLAEIPAAPRELAMLLDTALPITVGVRAARWSNVRSLVRKALQAAGTQVHPARSSQGLSVDWEEFRKLLPDKRKALGLSRFMHYCSAMGVPPGRVRQAEFEAFGQMIEASLLSSPARIASQTAKIWNGLSMGDEPFAKFEFVSPGDPRRYSLEWEAFPATLKADLDAYQQSSAKHSVLADVYVKPARPSTLKLRAQIVRQVASALVISGLPPSEIVDLSVLVQEANAMAALQVLIDRHGAETGQHLSQQAHTLYVIAKYWVKSPYDAQRLRLFADRLSPPRAGMTQKNKRRLQQFDLEDNHKALLTLPRRIQSEVKLDDDGGPRPARRMMMASLIEMLLMAPLRLKNFTEMEASKHLPEVRAGRRRTRRIAIPAKMAKTKVAFEAPIHAETLALLEDYLANYRDRLAPPGNPYLFPGRTGAPRSVESLSNAVSVFIRKETGLAMNPHLFRHLAALTYLRHNPLGLEVVRQLLGHSTLRTTELYYAQIKADFAIQTFDDLIAEKRREWELGEDEQ